MSDPRIRKAAAELQKRATVRTSPTPLPPIVIVKTHQALDGLAEKIAKAFEGVRKRREAHDAAIKKAHDAAISEAVKKVVALRLNVEAVSHDADGLGTLRKDFEQFSKTMTERYAPQGRGGRNGR
jgi:hypothetical protein